MVKHSLTSVRLWPQVVTCNPSDPHSASEARLCFLALVGHAYRQLVCWSCLSCAYLICVWARGHVPEVLLKGSGVNNSLHPEILWGGAVGVCLGCPVCFLAKSGLPAVLCKQARVNFLVSFCFVLYQVINGSCSVTWNLCFHLCFCKIWVNIVLHVSEYRHDYVTP